MRFAPGCSLLLCLVATSTDLAVAKNNGVRGSNSSNSGNRGNNGTGGSNGNGANSGNSGNGASNGNGGNNSNGGNNGQGNAHGHSRNKVGRVSKGREKADSKGNKHQRYQMTVDGVPVFGHNQVVHKNNANGRERVTEDSLPEFVDLDVVPTITEDDAKTTAINDVSENAGSVNVVSAELNILVLGGEGHLCFEVLLEKLDGNGDLFSMPMVFVDAHKNRILKIFETLDNVLLSDATHVTYDATNMGNIVVGDDSDQVLKDIHDHVKTTLDFLATTNGLNSYDDNGARALSVGHYGTNYVNAFWNGNYFAYGDGDGSVANGLGVLDIVAHEIGHAVTQYNSGLVYQDESGALNEGASDILGAVVEASVDGGVNANTWQMGEDSWINGALRYMNRPNRAHYLDRYTGTQDNGGVHWNSGILNYWFYLLSEGGQHYRADRRTGTTVQGVGIDTAYTIWYQAWEKELTSQSTFNDARIGTLAACSDLEYDPLTVCASVQNAWAEVGLGQVFVPPTPPPPPPVPTETCIQLDVRTDQYGNLDNSLFLTTGSDITWSQIDFAASTQYSFNACFALSECTRLRFIDTYGDGFLSGAMFKLTVDGNVETEALNFGCGYYKQFGACNMDCVDTTLTVRMDHWAPEDNSLTLTDQGTGTKIWEDPSFDRNEKKFCHSCLDKTGCYQLNILDSFGDGIPRSKAAVIAEGEQLKHRGTISGTGRSFSFGTGC